ncbi:glycoside hydrolase [Brachyspira pulli]|uniref:glycoside hydrolase n=1 Tax=Brachyspira pulli TaxID=310721 RepID=UPI003003D454
MKKYITILLLFILSCCNSKKINYTKIDYEVIPETFEISFIKDDIKIPISMGEKTNDKIINLTTNDNKITFEYSDKNILTEIKQVKDYLEVNIILKTEEDNNFIFPNVKASNYYLPFGEGKNIPYDDEYWKEYLSKHNEYTVLEKLSMPFVSYAYDNDYAVLCIMENPYNTDIVFDVKNNISFFINHQFLDIDKTKTNTYRIYLLENDITKIAKTYKNYIIEKGKFLTLEEKAKNNENIRKLYAAPHIYLSEENIISQNDINWKNFKLNIDSSIMNHIKSFEESSEMKYEVKQVFSEIKNLDYISEYHKNTICRYLTYVLMRDDFYNKEVFTNDIENYNELNISDKIQTNKFLLSSNLSDVFNDYNTFMNDKTVNIIEDMKKSGINNAWIGLHSWEQAYKKPELVKKANELGYLIASYDSYHSIHEPNNEKWITANFEDTSLYYNAAVENKDGNKSTGFNNVGRHLNPTLSLPAVKLRLSNIMKNDLCFNSWFIDCDATGEIFNDYSSNHITTQEEDLKARLERMSYIRDNYNFVVGSEGGNDLAAYTIAYAHGIELPTFSWVDKDMKNPNSEYYIGKYYSIDGGVPEHFSKRIPIKDKLYKIYLDIKYDIPLYKLVYNDSIITTYHWDWSTFKIKNAVRDRMLREILYNVPPLYHIDLEEWKRYKEDIINHHKVWSEFSKKVITKEMTSFEYLRDDKNIQKTVYGDDILVVANFSDNDFNYDNNNIAPHSLLIIMDNDKIFYTPNISENNI